MNSGCWFRCWEFQISIWCWQWIKKAHASVGVSSNNLHIYNLHQLHHVFLHVLFEHWQQLGSVHTWCPGDVSARDQSRRGQLLDKASHRDRGVLKRATQRPHSGHTVLQIVMLSTCWFMDPSVEDQQGRTRMSNRYQNEFPNPFRSWFMSFSILTRDALHVRVVGIVRCCSMCFVDLCSKNILTLQLYSL